MCEKLEEVLSKRQHYEKKIRNLISSKHNRKPPLMIPKDPGDENILYYNIHELANTF